jgi:RimJ/RimL family protein N-acetyltransferase
MDMKVHITNTVNKAELESLTRQYKYGRYCEDISLPLESSQRLTLDRLLHLTTQANTHVIESYSLSGELLGTLFFRLSQWDTEHFGYNVAIIEAIISKRLGYEQELEISEILVEKFLAWSESEKMRFISVRVPSLDLPVIHSLERRGFHYIENFMQNKYDLTRLDSLSKPPYELRLAQSSDFDLMVDFSREAFSTQRFHADAHIAHDKADSLYEKWIRTAFNDPDQKVLVLDIKHKPAAFMIYYSSDLRKYFGLQFAMWKMALLDPMNRSKGVGTDFFIACMYYHREEGLDVVDSGLTIRNLASLNLHNKLNFKIISTLVTLHKWLQA